MFKKKCPVCGKTKDIWKFGKIANKKFGGKKQRYFCNNCGSTFYIN